MGISTGTGDAGETSLMFGRRVSKQDSRVAACGDIDELNAALGLVRIALDDPLWEKRIGGIQESLVLLMGEVAVLPEDRDRYTEAGHRFLGEKEREAIVAQIAEWEKSGNIGFSGWAYPGKSGHAGAAAFDFARTVCRRCERALASLGNEDFPNDEGRVYMNRLSDYLWLAARLVERRD